MTTHIAQLKSVLSDPRFDRPTRLLRLQGWRGSELARARAAGNAHRVGPATCSALAVGVAITGSATLAVVGVVTALAGAFGRNHPAELVYNWIARRTSGAPIPSNRAAKRLACAIGSLFFTGAAVSFATGYSTAGRVLALTLGAVAAFVTISSVCVPSIIFTLLWGEQKATAPSLLTRTRAPQPPLAREPWVPVAGHARAGDRVG